MNSLGYICSLSFEFSCGVFTFDWCVLISLYVVLGSLCFDFYLHFGILLEFVFYLLPIKLVFFALPLISLSVTTKLQAPWLALAHKPGNRARSQPGKCWAALLLSRSGWWLTCTWGPVAPSWRFSVLATRRGESSPFSGPLDSLCHRFFGPSADSSPGPAVSWSQDLNPVRLALRCHASLSKSPSPQHTKPN